jgi:hypothetical protein
MSDSDSSIELIKVSSTKGHKYAPKEEDYKVKVKPCKTGTKFGFTYLLKKGTALPYTPDLESKYLFILIFYFFSRASL